MASSDSVNPSKNAAPPLSPHLQIYRLPLVAILSITHRVTGMANLAGTILLTVWLLAAAWSNECFVAVQGFMGSWIGQLMLLGWTLSLSYHLLNGVRHLFWDAGKGFELKTAYASGRAVIAGTFVLTAIIWGIALVIG
jgi:succinate dehydrogenase / fumarate reductase cytochrome b subunit